MDVATSREVHMSEESYLREVLETIENELDGIDSYEKFKNVDEYIEHGFYGLDEFSPLEIKFAKIYLRKRIVFFQNKNESINKFDVKYLLDLDEYLI